jgi:hypothetical protein
MAAAVPVPTTYRGVTYRSRTEARWAVFFDQLGVGAEYEPESYSIDGSWYLPDFFILEWNLFVEVKGEMPTPYERERCQKLSVLTSRVVYCAAGAPALYRGILFRDGIELGGNAAFAECKGCGTVAIVRREVGDIYPLRLPRGERRCVGDFTTGGDGMTLAVSAAADERFGVFPA